MIITQKRLKELIIYCSDTGLFTKNGKVAGTLDNRRIRIGVDGAIYRAHRLAWLYIYGVWPSGDIDHIDGNPQNNSINNLRDVSRSVNMQNQRKARLDNKTGFLGVSKRGNRFSAAITTSSGSQWLGTFSNPEIAHSAYVNAKRKLHEGCTI